MSEAAGRPPEGPPPSRGEDEARARLEALFAGFDRLTPFELERVGLRRRDDASRQAMLHDVAEAARATGRTLLLEEARARARETVLARYSAGAIHPTWVGLNWGISQGTIEDRVAIIEALEDAAAVAVVEDVLAPETVESLSLDAGLIMDMAAGEVSEGAFARQVRPPAAGLRATRGRWVAVVLGAATLGAIGFGITSVAVGAPAGLAVAIVTTGVVLVVARRGQGERT